MNTTLLFVDDDADDVKLTLLGFHKQGFKPHIVLAGDGKEALDLLAEDYAAARPLPHAILTDIKMPRMDGLEFLRHLKEDPRLREIPVGFLTSSGNEETKTEALRLGASFYILKPSNLDDYSGVVQVIKKAILPRATTR